MSAAVVIHSLQKFVSLVRTSGLADRCVTVFVVVEISLDFSPFAQMPNLANSQPCFCAFVRDRLGHPEYWDADSLDWTVWTNTRGGNSILKSSGSFIFFTKCSKINKQK